MRHCFRLLGATAALAVAAFAASPANAQSQPPGWVVHQTILTVSFEHCMGRARLALQGQGYKIHSVWRGLSIGANSKHTVAIACVAAPDSSTVANLA
jgi:hypothetical protein